MIKAYFIQKIIVTDPDTKAPVELNVYKESRGGMFAVDTSYIETELPVISPFHNGKLEIIN